MIPVSCSSPHNRPFWSSHHTLRCQEQGRRWCPCHTSPWGAHCSTFYVSLIFGLILNTQCNQQKTCTKLPWCVSSQSGLWTPQDWPSRRLRAFRTQSLSPSRKLVDTNDLGLPKGLTSFTQLVKVREGNLVLALPSIRFSWNLYQVISGTKYEKETSFGPITCHSWQDNGNERSFFLPIFDIFHRLRPTTSKSPLTSC